MLYMKNIYSFRMTITVFFSWLLNLEIIIILVLGFWIVVKIFIDEDLGLTWFHLIIGWI